MCKGTLEVAQRNDHFLCNGSRKILKNKDFFIQLRGCVASLKETFNKKFPQREKKGEKKSIREEGKIKTLTFLILS